MTDTRLQPSMARDPVCWMDVDPQTASFTYEHEGNTYVFCSRGCMLDFRDEPQHYLHDAYQPRGMDDLPP